MNGFPDFYAVIPDTPLRENDIFSSRTLEEISALYFKNDHHILSTDEINTLVTSGEISKKSFRRWYDGNKNKRFDEGEKLIYESVFFFSKDAVVLKKVSESITPGENQIVVLVEDNEGDVVSGQKHYIKIGTKVREELKKNPTFVNFNYQRNVAGIIDHDSQRELNDLVTESIAEYDSLANILDTLNKTVTWISDQLFDLAIEGVDWVVESLYSLKFKDSSWNPEKAESGFFQPIFFPFLKINPEDNSVSIISPNGQEYDSEALMDKVLALVFNTINEKTEGIQTFIKTGTNLIPIGITALIGNFSGLPDLIQPLVNSFKSGLRNVLNSFAGKLIEGAVFINAIICGLINSLIEAIASIFQIVSLILKIQKAGNQALAEISLWSEYIDNAIQAIINIDWIKVIEKIIQFQLQTLGKVISFLMNPSFNFSISMAEVGYFIGYVIGFIIEIVVGILFTGGVGSVKAAFQKLGKVAIKLFDTIVDIVKRVLGKVTKVSREVFSQVINFFKRGTDNLIKVIDDIKNAFLKWWDELLGRTARDLSPSDLSWMEISKGIGALGGRKLTTKQIRALKKILSQKKIKLFSEGGSFFKRDFKSIGGINKIDDFLEAMKFSKPPKVGGFHYKTRQFFLIEDATELVAFHELSHVKQFEEIGEIAYRKLSRLDRETYVWNQILKNRKNWTNDELIDSLNYINRVRSKEGLSLIKIKI